MLVEYAKRNSEKWKICLQSVGTSGKTENEQVNPKGWRRIMSVLRRIAFFSLIKTKFMQQLVISSVDPCTQLSFECLDEKKKLK